MKYDKVIVKQIPDENQSAINLSKYNRSRFPGCTDTYHASALPDGRFVTGLDPQGPDLQLIGDPEERQEIREEREALLKELEARLKVDLSPTSDFWKTFAVHISTDQDLILNRIEPLHVIMYHVLVSNGFVAPSRDAASNPVYRDTKYYCHVDEVIATEKMSTQKLRDQARAELYKISDNKDKLLLLGTYLEGAKYKKTMSPSTLYSMLSDFIDDSKNPENVSAFIKAAKAPVEDLQYKVTVETAIRKKIIKFGNGQYFRGGVNLGRNIIEVMKTLKLPDYANEFISIHEEVNSK